MRSFSSAVLLGAALVWAGCGSGAATRPGHASDAAWVGGRSQAEAASLPPGGSLAEPGAQGDDEGEPMLVRLHGSGRAQGKGLGDELFRNTYYDFPTEGAGDREATIYDAACAPIAKVPVAFHDQVCVQGSGRLAAGATVSFAKRDCPCAAECPRTGQKICFEKLDPARFPTGRGAMGRAITPLLTVAVDSKVIPLGTPIFIPEYEGLERPDGTKHDGCFVAEDRGVRVIGRQVDIFTGDPAVTARWNALVPSNTGVHVRLDDARCRRAAKGGLDDRR